MAIANRTTYPQQPPKVLAPDFAGMPDELKDTKTWVLWRYLPPKSSGGKWRKVPFHPSGLHANSTDPVTWSAFDECRVAYEKGGFSGVGFVFDGKHDANGLVYAGVDFDNKALVGGDQTQIKEWIDRLGSYVEASVSGGGLHIITKANPLTKGISRDGIELYTSGRYFTMTGHTNGAAPRPVVAAPDVFAAFARELDKASGGQTARQSASANNVVMLQKATLHPVFDGLQKTSLADGLEPNIKEIRSAVQTIPPSAIAEEPDWMTVARALAHTAADYPKLTEPLWEILDAASCRAPGYNQQDNRQRYERYIREAFNRSNPITLGSIYHLAAMHGWQGFYPAAGPTGPIKNSTVNDGPTGQNRDASGSSIRAVHVSNLPLVPPKRQWLHGTDLIRCAVTVLVAPGGRAKSTWLLTCALACASNRPLLGAHVFGGPLRVLCLSTEDGLPEMALRLRAAMQRYGLTDVDVPNLYVIGADRWGLPLLHAVGNRAVLDSNGINALTAELDQIAPDVVIIDPLINVMGGANANDNATAALLMGHLSTLAATRRIAVALAHHSSKGRDLASAESAMGAASFVNLARIALAIEPLDEKSAGTIGVPTWEAKRVFRVLGTKQNFSPPNGKDRWFRLTSVEMPNADPPIYMNGDQVAVVEPFDPGASGPAFPTELIRDALTAVADAEPPLSPSKQARDRYAVQAIADAIAPHRGGCASEIEGKSVLDHLMANDLVSVTEIKLGRSGGRSDPRKCLVLTPAGKLALQQSDKAATDTSPQSPQSPAVSLRGNAGWGPLGSPAPQGGYGGNAGSHSNGGDMPQKGNGDDQSH